MTAITQLERIEKVTEKGKGYFALINLPTLLSFAMMPRRMYTARLSLSEPFLDTLPGPVALL